MEEIKKAIEVLKAMLENKNIRTTPVGSPKSKLVCGPCSHVDNFEPYFNMIKAISELEVEKEPTYKPYSSVEEFLTASKIHGPYLKYKNVDVGVLPCQMDKHRIYLVSSGDHVSSVYSTYNYISVEYEVLYDNFIWQDGTPCGIRE